MKSAAAALLLLPGLAFGAEIRDYAARVDIEPGGAGRGAATLVVAGAPSETVEIPLAPSWSHARLGGPSDDVLFKAGKGATVRVTLPPAVRPEGSRFTFDFDVAAVFAKAEDPASGAKLTIPRESRTLRFAFVNSQDALIWKFGMLVVLPEGYRFQAIREQLPKPGKAEVEPRVRLGGDGGRQTAFLQLANLEQGDDTSMQLEAVPSTRSPLWLAAGAVLSLLYLVHFRDLVVPPPEPGTTR